MILYYFYYNKYLLHNHDFIKSNLHPHQLGVHQSKKRIKELLITSVRLSIIAIDIDSGSTTGFYIEDL